MNTKIARLRFQQAQRKQRFLRRICDEISQGKPTIVRVGLNPIRSGGVKGSPSVPLNDIVKAMQADSLIDVVVGPEDYSTTKCSACFNPNWVKRDLYCVGCRPQNTILPRPTQWRKIKTLSGQAPQNQQYQNLADYLVDVIKNGHWHRDGNASRNILYFLFCELHQILLHEAFRRVTEDE